MDKQIILLTGHSHAGKTKLAKALVGRYGMDYISTSSLVREKATRAQAAVIFATAGVDNDLMIRLLDISLEDTSSPVIIDSLRSVEQIRWLTVEKFPNSRVVTVHLDIRLPAIRSRFEAEFGQRDGRISISLLAEKLRKHQDAFPYMLDCLRKNTRFNTFSAEQDFNSLMAEVCVCLEDNLTLTAVAGAD